MESGPLSYFPHHGAKYWSEILAMFIGKGDPEASQRCDAIPRGGLENPHPGSTEPDGRRAELEQLKGLEERMRSLMHESPEMVSQQPASDNDNDGKPLILRDELSLLRCELFYRCSMK